MEKEKASGFVLDVPRKIIHTKALMVGKCNESKITDRREVPGLNSSSTTQGWQFCGHCYNGAAKEFPGMVERVTEVKKEEISLPPYLQEKPGESKPKTGRSEENPTP